MRVLSFDISASPGIALLEVKKGKPVLLNACHIETDSNHSDAQRYSYIQATATKFIHENTPYDVVVREKFIRGGSKRSTQLVFGAWASVDKALAVYGYKIDPENELVASTVKKAMSGNGRAEKEDVAEGVIKILGEDSRKWFFTKRGRLLDDRADAAGIGLTYLIKKGLIK